MKIAVLGGGSWGTALANVLAEQGVDVWLWVRREELAREIDEQGTNTRYLAGRALSRNLRASVDLAFVLAEAVCIVLALPCQHLGSFLCENKALFPREPPMYRRRWLLKETLLTKLPCQMQRRHRDR